MLLFIYSAAYILNQDGRCQSLHHFSESEAPDPLKLSLQYFFDKEQNKYEFSNAFL